MHTEEQYILEIGHALAENHAAVMVGAGFSKNAEKISADGRIGISYQICFMKSYMVTVNIREKIIAVLCD